MGALINPGELVGIIGAQTLGEISTQLTLNSVTYETDIIVRDANKHIRKVQIGEFIEKIHKYLKQNNKQKTQTNTIAPILIYLNQMYNLKVEFFNNKPKQEMNDRIKGMIEVIRTSKPKGMMKV